jgi:hypothetical protein
MIVVLPNIHFSKGVCGGCVLGKHPREKFDKGKTQKNSFHLDLIHSDLMGPFPNPSISKARYVLIFVDDFSRFTWIFFLGKKSKVFQHLKDFKSLVLSNSYKRRSEDLIENLFGIELFKLYSSQDLIIHNGVMKLPNSNQMTCIHGLGSSAID